MKHSEKVAQELVFFKEMDLNALPEIYGYWSNKYLTGFLEQAFGSQQVIDIFARELGASVVASRNPVIVSIGAGDALIDELVATRMLELGFTDFRFECLELSSFLIERAQERLKARDPNLASRISFKEIELSQWEPKGSFGGCFAHQCLHHVEALEHVFSRIKKSLAPQASFVTSDMIGRNGHMRWPETLAIINAIWVLVPEDWKNNRPLQRFEQEFINHDCSTHGFEGVRAQDILPMCVEQFHFHKFSAWGGLIDPFVDRSFGHNLSSNNELDCAFINSLWEANRLLVRLGAIKPTQMIAVMKNEPGDLISSDGLVPASCIRPPSRAP
jgi:SAM-dependent methyltransferase